VSITGTGFSGATSVQFGTTNAQSYSVNSATSITAVVPDIGANNTSVAVIITVPGGTAISNSNFSYASATSQAPVITSFSPTSGTPGTSITITGTGFSGAIGVQFGSSNAQQSFTVISDNVITAIVPNLGNSNTSTGITVMTLTGNAVSSNNFSYISPGSNQNNSSSQITPFASPTQASNTGISWSLVLIILSPILVIGLIVLFITGNKKKKLDNGEVK